MRMWELFEDGNYSRKYSILKLLRLQGSIASNSICDQLIHLVFVTV